MTSISTTAHTSTIGYRMGSGALFLSETGQVLLVKPAYKAGWEIPGGLIEPGESPRACCTREVREELGLELPIGRLLVLDWLPSSSSTAAGLMFVYDGGTLSSRVISGIVLMSDELLEWRFVSIEEIAHYLPAHMARRIQCAFSRSRDGSFTDLEYGEPPDNPADSLS